MATGKRVVRKDIRHVHICGGKDLYCAHPRQYGMWNFGNGEIAVVHAHAPWDYRKEYPMHGFGEKGYKSRAVTLLQRSMDNGETWPEENNVVVWGETKPVEERKAFVEDRAEREIMDLSSPDAIVMFIRTWFGDMTQNDRLAASGRFSVRTAARPGVTSSSSAQAPAAPTSAILSQWNWTTAGFSRSTITCWTTAICTAAVALSVGRGSRCELFVTTEKPAGRRSL